MNKAITDGLVFMPLAFSAGLGVWSSEDGTAGSATYNAVPNAALVTGDPDFGSCLELQKTTATQKLRYMGQTPILPGCYLRIRARVKAMSGNLASVRIAGYAMSGANVHVSGLVEVGPSTLLTSYGAVTEISAIVGSGARGGVAMPWGAGPSYGHFGLDLTGSNGGIVRIESIEIEDITEAYLRDMLALVDVRDYGAKGDGVSDDRAAFVAADAAAAGREILVPEGTYFIGSSLSIAASVRFEGTVTMAASTRFTLLKNFDFPTYAAAFGSEQTGLEKGLQSLFTFSDHTEFDLRGRRVELTRPLKIAQYAPELTTWANRRVLCNGQLNAQASSAWDSVTVTSQASYSTAAPTTLSGVVNVANIAVGARVTGTGVGREIYVKAVNIAAGTVTLSNSLYGLSGTRVFTFTRDQYLLDFSGVSYLARFHMIELEMLCNGLASGVMLAPEGEMFHMHDCMMIRPKDRGITSIGAACQDMVVDRCEFLSNEMDLAVPARTTIAINTNKNDVKIRNSRFVRFHHTMVLGGAGNLIVGNHWFQSDNETNGVRTAGLVFTQTNVKSAVTGNYLDNCTIEWTNEYETEPDFASQYSFGGLSVTGNIFTVINVAPWFTFFTLKPYGTGHHIYGLTVTGNTFRAIFSTLDRVETVDDSIAPLSNLSNRNILWEGNTYHGITNPASNPVFLQHDQATAATAWTVDPARYLPFGGAARNVESLVFEGAVTNASNVRVTEMPYVSVEQGTEKQQVTINFAQAAKGRAHLRVRMDNPN